MGMQKGAMEVKMGPGCLDLIKIRGLCWMGGWMERAKDADEFAMERGNYGCGDGVGDGVRMENGEGWMGWMDGRWMAAFWVGSGLFSKTRVRPRSQLVERLCDSRLSGMMQLAISF
jgi:hypothetical protein